jgi:hypothetical protein
MFNPLMKIAIESWQRYYNLSEDWAKCRMWSDGLAKIAGSTGKTTKVLIMSRDNPAWQGKILLQKFDQNGEVTGWGVSNTRGSRDAAYAYLIEQGGFQVRL